jgi:hypothetical protein
MSTLEATEHRQARDTVVWLKVVLGAVAWVMAYRLNDGLWNWLLFDVIGLDPATRLGSSLHFFFYDTIKIFLLLGGIVFLMSLVRSFVPLEKTRDLLEGRRQGVGNVAAAGLGVVTPFCSCSAVPAFIGFVSVGVPLGVTLTFLIASPLVNEVALVLLLGMFGWQIALIYVVAGLTIAIFAGYVLGRLGVERWVEPFVFEVPAAGSAGSERPSTRERMALAREEVRRIVGKTAPYLIIGIALGALIHGWVPESLFVRYAGTDNPFAVLFAVLLGVPLYSNAAGVLPLVEALHAKGLPMGTLLAFMMAVVALSLPEMILLRRVLRPPLIAAFIGVVAVGILIVGYLFNAIL